jgi:hypothetical protein
MTSRRANDGGSVLSFTFLDVLMCTMGSLLLLLVVFGVIAKKSTRARREGEEARISLAALKAPNAPPAGVEAPVAAPTDASDPAALARQLERVRAEQETLERLRGQAAERRRDEAARIAHLEDHERRLEHDLGKLHVALQTLKSAEEKQSVDQVQAEAEARRLKELIRETEERLTEMRKAGAGDKSYAIVPYKGASGTFRRPVFIECTADAVTIQPEGIRLTVEDFDGPLRSGNPLAAAVRAAHEELNGRAAAAGQTALPDPYPLLIVRPDGAAAYAAALDAIRSWDSDYGYEFVEADWKLKYPELDPRLAQVMAHAVDEARQRQALLARVAPRRYAPRLGGGGVDGGLGGLGEGDGAGAGYGGGAGRGFESLGGGSGNRIGDHGVDGALSGRPGGNPLRGAGGSGGNFADEFNDTAMAGTGPRMGVWSGGGGMGGLGSGSGGSGGTAGPGQLTGGPGGPGGAPIGGVAGAPGAEGATEGSGQPGGANGEASGAASGTFAAGSGSQPGGASGDASAAAGGSGSSANGDANARASGGAGGASASSGASGSAGGTGGAAATSSGSIGGGMGGLPPVQVGQRHRGSAAETRGTNWANAEASRKAAAITRPIKVQVNRDQLLVLDADGRPIDDGAVSFQQPVDGVMDQLSAAVQRQIADWGLAGDRMYWRPTLVVSVTPGAERQAERLSELLDNSGIDIRLPQATAQAGGGGRGAR